MSSGKIFVNTENIFPIIKKFLYTDQEIFVRELVSNASDAIQKLKILSNSGEYQGELIEGKIEVIPDKEAKTITFRDNGLGMDADEIEKYINQIAFSGAEEFAKKLDENKDNKEAIIGHFGLGFYSSFMVATKVEIISKSYKEGSKTAHWSCDGTTNFELSEGSKDTVGTDIILHINADSENYLEDYELKNVLTKYCSYFKTQVFFKDEQINKKAIWQDAPAELKDEDYTEFYKELFPFQEEPLFWIHLNIDYPFKLTGILYFPKIKKEIDPNKKRIKLFSNRVFVTDNVEEIVPEYLMLLQGVIDSPDIPLNVSRSALQSDSNVKKINSHISKKVADRLKEEFKKDRTEFENKWEHLSTFIKYGMLTDDKFYDRSKDVLLLKNTKNSFKTLEEYDQILEANQIDKDKNKIALYTNNAEDQHAFVQAVENKGYDVLVLDDMLDAHFIGLLESKVEKLQLKRVDSDPINKLIDKDEQTESVLSGAEIKNLQKYFKDFVEEKNYETELVHLSSSDDFVSLVEPEFQRRMKQMSEMSGQNPFMAMPDEKLKLLINTNHKAASQLASIEGEDKAKEKVQLAIDIALLAQNKLKGEAMTRFIKNSFSLLAKD